MHFARRDHDEGPVAQVAGGRAEDRILEFRPGRLENGQRAVQAVPGPVAGQAAQGKSGELGRADGILGAARRELPHLSVPAAQHVQGAVDVDDLDQLGRTKLVQQLRDIHTAAGAVGHTPGLQRTGADHALEPQLFPLQRHGRPAFPPRLLEPAGHLA